MIHLLDPSETLAHCRRRLLSIRFLKPSRTLWWVLIFPITALLFTPFTSEPRVISDSEAAFGWGVLLGLMAVGLFQRLYPHQKLPVADHVNDQAILEYSHKISQSCEEPLQQVIQETEQSALEIITQVKELDHTATDLVDYLLKADRDTLDMQTRIDQNTTIIERTSAFMQQLPTKIEAERQLMKRIESIVSLSHEVAENIQDISRQTNMVALNIIIQAAHVGEKGRGLTVVANEVRRLSECSSEAAHRVTRAVNDIQEPMRAYTCEFQRDFTQDLQEATQITGSVSELQDSYEDMKQYYKTLLTVIKNYNTHMADAIVNTLGNIQYQDVVRQRLERVLTVQARYRDVLQIALDDAVQASSPNFLDDLEQVLKGAIEEEQRHGAPSIENSQSTGLRIELF